MEFREFAWAQQLYRQRALYGAAAEATERSYPKYPGAALRELVRQSAHPHNLEPLLLTLRRPANADTRARFADVAGELVLVERALSATPAVQDLQIVVGGRVEAAPDGMLYPDRRSQVPFEAWVRAEMLDGLARMLGEGRVRSLTPAMQSKLVADLAALAGGDRGAALGGGEGESAAAQPTAASSALVRGYALRAAAAAAAAFNSVRAELAGAPGAGGAATVVTPGLLARGALDALRLATADEPAAAAEDGEQAEDGKQQALSTTRLTNPFAVDPLERLALMAAACGALLLAAARGGGADVGGAAALPAGATVADAAARLPGLACLAEAGAGPLLARALEATAAALAERDAVLAAPAPASGGAEKGGEKEEQEDGAAIDKVAAGELSFEDNWRAYLRQGFAGDAVARDAAAVVALGGALLQLLARRAGAADGDERAWPAAAALARLAAAEGPGFEAIAAAARALQADGGDGAASGHGDGAVAAVCALPEVAAIARGALTRRCCQCGKPEVAAGAGAGAGAGEGAAPAPLKRCGACQKAFYCSAGCQKAAWAGGHKAACKQLAAAAAAAGAASGGAAVAAK